MRTFISRACTLWTVVVLGCSDPTGPKDAIRLDLEVPAQVQVGDAVRLQLTVANVTTQPVSVSLSCSPWHIEIVGTDGTPRLRSWEGPQFGCGSTLSLEPSESVVYTSDAVLRDQDLEVLEPGSYVLTASLRGTEMQALVESAPKTVVIEP